MSRAPLLLLALVAAACARSEDASVAVDPNSVQPAERVRSLEADDGAIAIGEWRESLQDENEALEFGPAGAAPLFSLRCDTRRSLIFQRHGGVHAGDLPMMLVSIGSETRRLAVTSVSGPVPMLRASLPQSDPLAATLARATAPITIRIGEGLPLMLPPSPAIGAFLTECSAGPAASSTVANEAEAENSASPAPANAAQPAPPPRR